MKTKTALFAKESRVAVILGDCFSSRLLALELWARGGVESIICDRKRSALGLLIPVGTFRRLYHGKDRAVILCQLDDIALASRGEEICFLVAESERYTAFLREYKRQLEDKYVIADRAELKKLLRDQ